MSWETIDRDTKAMEIVGLGVVVASTSATGQVLAMCFVPGARVTNQGIAKETRPAPLNSAFKPTKPDPVDWDAEEVD